MRSFVLTFHQHQLAILVFSSNDDVLVYGLHICADVGLWYLLLAQVCYNLFLSRSSILLQT